MSLSSWDGESKLSPDMLCSWGGIPSVCRWVGDDSAILENQSNGLLITVGLSEVLPAMTEEEVSSKELQDLVAAYTGEPEGLGYWLASRGVIINKS